MKTALHRMLAIFKKIYVNTHLSFNHGNVIVHEQKKEKKRRLYEIKTHSPYFNRRPNLKFKGYFCISEVGVV